MPDGQSTQDAANETAAEETHGVEPAQPTKVSKLTPKPSPPRSNDRPDPGMVGLSIALAAIALTLAQLLPSPSSTFWTVVVVIIAFLLGATSALSSYAALWLLALRHVEERSGTGFSEIRVCLRTQKLGPHFVIAWAMVIWCVLSFFVGALVIANIITGLSQ